MKTRLLLIACIFCLKANTLFAQAMLGAFSVTAPDTVYSAYPDSLFISIKNTGNFIFNGNVSIHVKINALPDLPFDSIPMVLPPHAIGIYGQPNFNWDSLGFVPGHNIVVVWPTGTGIATATDSVTFSVYFIDNIGIPKTKNSSELRVNLFPNPANKEIRLQYSGTKNQIEQVRIFDLFGREVVIQNNSFSSIGISGLPKGIYLLEVIFDDRSRTFLKFVAATP